MKTVILAGGLGTRLSEYTHMIPKPMVEIGGKPILWHIMAHYAAYGFTDFGIALGYKAEVIKEYFLNLHALNSDFTVDLGTGELKYKKRARHDWRVTLVDTGKHSMTGGRVRLMQDYIQGDPFCLTYGDGVSDINIGSVIKFHQSHKKMVTVTAVHPTARFGELDISEDGNVFNFKEKPQTHAGWINGGFFVCEPEFLDLIVDNDTVLEKEPLEEAAKSGELVAYRHEGFWQCMDTARDRILLDKLWESGQAPWKNWDEKPK